MAWMEKVKLSPVGFAHFVFREKFFRHGKNQKSHLDSMQQKAKFGL